MKLSVVTTALLHAIIGLPCGTYEDITKQLREKYKEVEVAVGVTSTNGLIIRMSNPHTGTWTLLRRVAGLPGLTCIIATGQGWEIYDDSQNCGEVKC